MVGLVWFFQARLIHFNCPSLAGNHIIAFPLTSARAVQAAPRRAAHSPAPTSLAGRCHPSLTNFPAPTTLPGPCSLFQRLTSKDQLKQGQIWGCINPPSSAMEGLMHSLSFPQGKAIPGCPVRRREESSCRKPRAHFCPDLVHFS